MNMFMNDTSLNNKPDTCTQGAFTTQEIFHKINIIITQNLLQSEVLLPITN